MPGCAVGCDNNPYVPLKPAKVSTYKLETYPKIDVTISICTIVLALLIYLLARSMKWI